MLAFISAKQLNQTWKNDFQEMANMKNQFIVVLASFSLTLGLANAAASAAIHDQAKADAAARFASDKKLCAEEADSSSRMQCLRDAKAEYDKAISSAKQSQPAGLQAAKDVVQVCADCGKVVAVRVSEKKGEGSPAGMIAGGVAGAILGHQVGQGRGKDLATIAGAAGGAYAGHKIEQNMRSTKQWVVSVRFDDGSMRDFNYEKDPGLAEGVLVKNTQAGLVRR